MPSAKVTIARPKIITVLNTGIWGATIITLARRNRNLVREWSPQSNQPLSSAIAQSDIIISAVSAAEVSIIIHKLKQINLANTILVTATKGLDCPQDESQIRTPAQIWQTAFPDLPVVVLSGANLATEIAQGLPTATIVASNNLSAAKTVQQAFAGENFWVHINPDPLGTELGGILKNIMAIAVGLSDGLELGANAKAIILTQAMPEMIRLGTYLGGDAATLLGLSGWGDLVASCEPVSRNYQLGYQLAQGKSLEDIISQLTGVTEDLKTTEVMSKIVSQGQINAPITNQVAQLLQNQISPHAAIYNLISSELTPEFQDVNLRHK